MGWASDRSENKSKLKTEERNSDSRPKSKAPEPSSESKDEISTRLNWSIRYDEKSELPWVYQYRWKGLGNDLDFNKVEEFLRGFPKEFQVINASDWEKDDHSDKDAARGGKDGKGGKDRDKGEDQGDTKSWVFTFRSSYAPDWGDRDAKVRDNWRTGITYDFSKYFSGPFDGEPWEDPNYGGKGIFKTIQSAWPRDHSVPIPGLREPELPASVPVPEASAGFGLVSLAGAAAYLAHRRRRTRSTANSTEP
jgi:MYXO-CTERM domain-containing protein